MEAGFIEYICVGGAKNRWCEGVAIFYLRGQDYFWRLFAAQVRFCLSRFKVNLKLRQQSFKTQFGIV